MAENDHTGNLPPTPGVFPNTVSPVVRNGPLGRELAMMRWGMPTPPWVLLKGKPKGTDPRTVTRSWHDEYPEHEAHMVASVVRH